MMTPYDIVKYQGTSTPWILGSDASLAVTPCAMLGKPLALSLSFLLCKMEMETTSLCYWGGGTLKREQFKARGIKQT